MSKQPIHRPPAHLKTTTKKWWKLVTDEYELDSHHLKLLQAACEAWDRLQDAREVLNRDGVSYIDRFNAPRARPEVAVERDSRIGFARLVRELGLDAAGNPSAPRGNPLKY